MTYYLKEDIYRDLEYLNDKLKQYNMFLSLRIVGGAALLFNGVKSYETEDIDTLSSIEELIKDVIDDCSIDINNDVLDYIEEFDDADFVKDDKQFSNIYIEYLDIGYVIKTKMAHSDLDKLEALAYMLEEEFGVDMSVDGLYSWLRKDQGVAVDYDLIENFLTELDYL